MPDVTARPLLWTLPQAALRLNVSRSTLYKIIGAGELDALKIGVRTYVTEDSIAAYIKKLKADHPAEIAPRWQKPRANTVAADD